MERANNATRPRDSEAMKMELLQSQRKGNAARLSQSVMLWESVRVVWGSVRALWAVIFILYAPMGKQKPVGNNEVGFTGDCGGH